MRKIIDRIALYALLTVGAFVLFLYAYRSFYPALFMSLAFLLALVNLLPPLLNKASLRRSTKAKRVEREDRMLEALLYMPQEEALKRAKGAVLSFYGHDESGDDFGKKTVRFAFFQRHQDGFPVDASAVAKLYGRHKGSDVLIVMNTGAYDEKARRLAEGYASPRLLLFDGPQLKKFLGRFCEETEAQEDAGKKKKRRRPRIVLSPKLSRRSAIYAALLMAMYLILGINAYLFASLSLLALALVSRRKAITAPEKLI